MRSLLGILCLFILIDSARSQNDSIHLVFGYADSTEIAVEVLSDNPDLEPKSIVLAGLGSIGSAESGALATQLEFRQVLGQYLSFDARWAGTIQDASKDLKSSIDLIAHLALFNMQSKAPMSIKLLDVKVEDDKRTYKQPFYAQHPFQVRHDVRMDFGISVVSDRSKHHFNTINAKQSFYTGSSFNNTNALLGLSYSRTRRVKLKINGLKESDYYGKLNIGAHAAYNLSNSATFSLCAFNTDTICIAQNLDEIESLDLYKLGYGFDVGYTFLTAKPKWVMSFEFKGRFIPAYFGDAHFYDDNAYELIEDYKFGSSIWVMPSISVGYILN